MSQPKALPNALGHFVRARICDRCGGSVRAKAEIITGSGRPLYFCQHHMSHFAEHIKEMQYTVRELKQNA